MPPGRRPAKGVANADAFENLPKSPTPADLKKASVSVSLAELEQRVDDVSDSWETDSLFEDVIDSLTTAELPLASSNDGASPSDPETCTVEEGARLRAELREFGPAVFCDRYIDSGKYTARKLLTAFNIRPPPFLDGQDDEDHYPLLTLAMSRELQKRAKLTRWNTVDDVVALLKSCNNVMVVTGAGISTSLGIPDFRSKGTGLYSRLEHLGLNDPQEVFDIDVFKEDPSIFYSVAKDIIPSTDRYTPTHRFIAMLHERGKLLTNYSQNIDNLEVKAGVPASKLIQCHGSFGSASCIKCGWQCPGETVFPEIRAGKIPRCVTCTQSLRPTGTFKRKRSGNGTDKPRRRRGASDDDDDDDDAYDVPSAGVMKPDITFFGEALPSDFSTRLTTHDRDKVDLCIVIGTSLKVTPVSEIARFLPPHIPQVYISRQPVSHINFDIDLLGDCDVVVSELCRRLGWELKHEMVPEDEVVDVKAVEGFPSRHTFETRK
ncbi:sir2 family protein [Sarocladium implicatum]|nr:sir2 family protein [Sarocladium implicatum]